MSGRIAVKPQGLYLRFSKDFSCKFVHRKRLKAERAHGKNQNIWHVAGEFDLLQIKPFSDLEEIEGTYKAVADLFLGSVNEVVLFPLSGPASFAEFFTRISSPQPKTGMPFLVVVNLSLSPAAYEFGDTFLGVLNVLDEANRQLRNLMKDNLPETYLFRTLGSPDIVAISLPTTVQDLAELHEFAFRASQMPLAKIIPPPVDSQQWPGHAFSTVQPILSFQRDDLEVFNTNDFKTQESELGMSLSFRLHLDCGHEPNIAAQLKERFPSIKLKANANGNETLSWNQRKLEGTFENFSQFISVLNTFWYDDDWRDANLVSSETTVSFPSNFLKDHQSFPRVWELNAAVQKELHDIETAIDSFSQGFLAEPQRTELLALFHSFRSCFYRHELLSVARDLMPFFRQLKELFSLKQLFTEYLKDPDAASPHKRFEEFSQSIHHLLQHASRAVRNRMDFRKTETDPPLPHTLDHGACKLVNAYTIVFYLCWEYFRLEKGHIASFAPGVCSADHFAACVCVGVDGRVVCEEALLEFRKFVEERHNGHQLSTIPDLQWKSRIILLDISGKALMRPESCLVHCLHEVSEMSEWIELPRMRDLRKSLNLWVYGEVVLSLARRTAEIAGKKDLKLARFIQRFVIDCTLRNRGIPATSLAEASREFQSLAADTSPVRFLTILREAIQKEAPLSKLRTEWSCFSFVEKPDVFVHICDAAADSDSSLSRRYLYPLLTLLNEVVSDVGMWCALDSILSPQDGDQSRNRKHRLADVMRVFESTFIAAEESRGSNYKNISARDTLILRWSSQAQAIAERGDDSWKDEIVERIDALHRAKRTTYSGGEARKALNQLGFRGHERSPYSLVTQLREFKPYGGSTDLRFPLLSELSGPEEALLNQFKKTWLADTQEDIARERVEFVLMLWAKSVRFRFDQCLLSVKHTPSSTTV